MKFDLKYVILISVEKEYETTDKIQHVLLLQEWIKQLLTHHYNKSEKKKESSEQGKHYWCAGGEWFGASAM